MKLSLTVRLLVGLLLFGLLFSGFLTISPDPTGNPGIRVALHQTGVFADSPKLKTMDLKYPHITIDEKYQTDQLSDAVDQKLDAPDYIQNINQVTETPTQIPKKLSAPPYPALGYVWSVVESGGWGGTWIRMEGSKYFSATMTDQAGNLDTYVVEITEVLLDENNRVYSFKMKRPNKGTFSGVLNPASYPSSMFVLEGNADWYTRVSYPERTNLKIRVLNYEQYPNPLTIKDGRVEDVLAVGEGNGWGGTWVKQKANIPTYKCYWIDVSKIYQTNTLVQSNSDTFYQEEGDIWYKAPFSDPDGFKGTITYPDGGSNHFSAYYPFYLTDKYDNPKKGSLANDVKTHGV